MNKIYNTALLLLKLTKIPRAKCHLVFVETLWEVVTSSQEGGMSIWAIPEYLWHSWFTIIRTVRD